MATHDMAKIMEVFGSQTCHAPTDEKGRIKLQVVVDWPISAGFKGTKEYKKFFEWAKHLSNYNPNIKEVIFPALALPPDSLSN